MNKKVFIIILISFSAMIVLSSCDTEAEKAAANKAVVEQAMEAMGNQDYEALDQYFVQDYRRHCQATPELKVESIDDMIKFLKQWYDAFPDATIETHMMAAEGDLVAVYITFAGTHTAQMNDIPATGKRLESETFGFHRLEDGKIAETWVTWDNMAIMKQLGLFPPSPE
jgi:steroid delta-isomerase-like uncharacterized protein